jgi:leucyl aminopeptidase (aminopeptidase T)
MSWPEREAITRGVVNMVQVNMGLKLGERLLVVTDVPRVQDWRAETHLALQDMVERAVLARLVADIAGDHFPESEISFLAFPASGGHGTEPDQTAAARMRGMDAVVALTTYSLTHTDARGGAAEAGVRFASMPGFEARMFEAGGPMAADYRQISSDCEAFAAVLTLADEVVLRTPYGTHLSFSLKGRPGQVDGGIYDGTGPNIWGNLPAGEVYAVPVEGSGEGQLVVPTGWYPDLTEDMTLDFRAGEIVSLGGGGAAGVMFRKWLALGDDDPIHKARRNLAELGIGANPMARRPENVLEAEKIKGTVHIGIGDNLHMGGRVESDLHEDLVQPKPDLLVDGRLVIAGGEWRI